MRSGIGIGNWSSRAQRLQSRAQISVAASTTCPRSSPSSTSTAFALVRWTRFHTAGIIKDSACRIRSSRMVHRASGTRLQAQSMAASVRTPKHRSKHFRFGAESLRTAGDQTWALSLHAASASLERYVSEPPASEPRARLRAQPRTRQHRQPHTATVAGRRS